MIYIAHRGNILAKNASLENSPAYVHEALSAGFDAEVDVWYANRKWMLGHDRPQYEIDISFFRCNGLWCHAKNVAALQRMLEMNIHCFWHQTDDVALTSRGYIWTYPGQTLATHSVCVMPEKNGQKFDHCIAVCSDQVMRYRNAETSHF